MLNSNEATMEIIELVFLAIFFWVWGIYNGWNLRESFAKKRTEILLKSLNEMEEDESDIVNIVIEKYNDMFIVYNKDTKQYMAQGNSKQEIEENLRKMFPGKVFTCSHINLAEHGFKL